MSADLDLLYLEILDVAGVTDTYDYAGALVRRLRDLRQNFTFTSPDYGTVRVLTIHDQYPSDVDDTGWDELGTYPDYYQDHHLGICRYGTYYGYVGLEVTSPDGHCFHCRLDWTYTDDEYETRGDYTGAGRLTPCEVRTVVLFR